MWITDDVDDMQFERNISYGVLSMRATRMICALGSADLSLRSLRPSLDPSLDPSLESSRILEAI